MIPMDLDTGSLNGVLLEMEHVGDDFCKAIARYEYPHADGADLDDLGQNARTVRTTAWFWDDGGSHNTYDDHYQFLALLDGRDLLDYQHPKYGLLKGKIEKISVRHDEKKRTAVIDFDFVEQGRQSFAPVRRVDVVAETEAALETGVAEADGDLSDDIAASFPQDGLLDLDLDPLQGLLGQFSGLTRPAWEFVAKIDAAVRTAEGALTDIANPANSLLSIVSFGTKLPGRLLSSLARCAERYARLYDGVRNAPASFLEGVRTGLLELEAMLPGTARPYCRHAAALRLGVEAAALLAADAASRQTLARAGSTPSFDRLGRYTPAPAAPAVMTADTIEACLAVVRTVCQEAVTLLRRSEAPKIMAAVLLEQAETILLESEHFTTVYVDRPLPLHLLCLQYGLDYGQAERVLAANPQIANPNFVRGEVWLYGR